MTKSPETKISSLLADAVQRLVDDTRARSTEAGFTNINIRPTANQAALIETIAKIRNRNPTSMMAADISAALAEMLSESKDFIPVIEEAFRLSFEKREHPIGALKILGESAAVEIKKNNKSELFLEAMMAVRKNSQK
jgi:uncharacterized protein (DUF1778 family)